jgi:hypothetical protein
MANNFEKSDKENEMADNRKKKIKGRYNIQR